MSTKIACSPLTGRIFQGRVNKDLNAFVGQKKDVTSDVLESVIAKAEFHGGTFDIEGGGRKWKVTLTEQVIDTDTEPRYYLQDTRGYVGNCPLWWAINGNGYTTDLRKAHRYTLAEAMSQHRSRQSDLPWACDEIDALQRPTVDMQDMHKLRAIADQREAITKLEGGAA